MKTLADLKRYVAKPNAKVRLTYLAYPLDRFTSVEGWVECDLSERMSGWREVCKVDTTGFGLDTPAGDGLPQLMSWAEFDVASVWSFEGNFATKRTEFVHLTYEVTN